MSLIPKILIVSNLQTTSPLWAFNVTKLRLNVLLESNPANTIRRWTETLPDMVVLDIDSESLAIELITRLRDESALPILLLTSSRSEKFMLEAYQAGVDEFVLRPIHPTLFDAKIQAWLRHSWNAPVDMLDSLQVGSFHLIPSNRALELGGGDPIHLTNLELRLLYYLMGRPGRTLTTTELCQRVWSRPTVGDAVTLKNLVYRLRRKIEADPAHPHYIRTVAGVGYRFMAK